MNLKLNLPEDDDEIDITPMLDCIFLLVLFFMVTSSFIEEAKAFQITVPHADQATTIKQDNIDSVTVTVDGRYAWRAGTAKEKPLKDLEELLQELQQRDAAGKARPVIIRCDARCEYQQFIRVKNVLKLAGVETIFEEVEVRQ